jgi:hypothetical protein
MTSTFLVRSQPFLSPLSIPSGIRYFSTDLYLCRALLTRKSGTGCYFGVGLRGGCTMRSHSQTDRPRGTGDLDSRWPSIRAASVRKGAQHTVCGDAPNQASLHFPAGGWSAGPFVPSTFTPVGGVVGVNSNIRFSDVCVLHPPHHPEIFLCGAARRGEASPSEL